MFIEAKDDEGGGDNWTTGAISRAKFQSNHHHCKIPVSYYVSGHRGHRRCLCDSPTYLGRPDPLSFKWIGRQFE